MKKRYLLLIILLFFQIFSIASLELTEGRIKLVIQENTGRFSLFFLEDVRRGNFIPLFFSQDPRTSVLSVLVENRVFRMGEGADFRQTVEQIPDGALITWRSQQFEVTQKFTFIKSVNSVLTDGISIEITIRNVSEQNLSLGARYLLDTYLGEKSNAHFLLSDGKEIKSELDLKGSLPDYFVSKRDDQIGFQCMLSGEGIVSPSRVIFGNWKRMNDTSWAFDSILNRNFNLLPYSINDSAVLLYYDPIVLSPKGNRMINILLGNFNPKGFSTKVASSVDTNLNQLYSQTVTATSRTSDSAEISVRTDLLTVNDLIKQIDKKFQSGNPITQEEILVFRQILEELKNRKKSYEGR